jgi:DNA polymerase
VDDSLDQVAAEVSACTRCSLHQSRVKAVPGEGRSDAQIMFIGEGPGFHENESGRPFVGAAGDFLNDLLSAIGLHRNDVFICNVVKCRPPGNRDPELEEISACSGYLERQIKLINPKVIVTLGRFSMARWFPDARISAIHGKPRKVDHRIIVPMFHPAAALHRPDLKPTVIEDFKRLPVFLAEISNIEESIQSEAEAQNNQAQQLRLF